MALHRYLVEEVALDCAEGLLDRREALRRLSLLGLSASGAAALLAACADGAADDDDDSDTEQEPPAPTSTDPLTTEPADIEPATSAPTTTGPSTSASVPSVPGVEIRFDGPNGELIGVLATAEPARGAVLVIHENRGLTPHIRSIPSRLAADGFTAMAIDLLSEEGGTANLPSEDDATALLGNARYDRLIGDLRAGVGELARLAPGAKLGAVGFCFGGGMVWQLLDAGEPRLAAAVPFYGPTPDDPDFSKSAGAAVLGIYAGNDDRVNATRDIAKFTLTVAGVTHELRTFEGVGHAFFNDTGQRYDVDAAAAAYQAMIDWFTIHLA